MQTPPSLANDARKPDAAEREAAIDSALGIDLERVERVEYTRGKSRMPAQRPETAVCPDFESARPALCGGQSEEAQDE